jgi:predicted phage terminase large subunit-like protein
VSIQLAQLPPERQREILSLAAAAVKGRRAPGAIPEWSTIRRAEQIPPLADLETIPGHAWRTWLLLAGRGFGKSRTGAETLCEWVEAGRSGKIMIAAPTAADCRDLSVAALQTRITGFDNYGKPIIGHRPGIEYEPSKRLVIFANGAKAWTFSAEDPDSFRGYEVDTAWLEEVASWKYPESYDQAQFGLRIGWGRQIVTTTPKPVRIIRELLKDPSTVATRGRTLDNAKNLSDSALDYLIGKYGGTQLGRQELDAEILDDMPGALWHRPYFTYSDAPRIAGRLDLVRVVVGIDPATTSTDSADETGIVAAGKATDRKGYVLADRSGRYTPDGWARKAVDLAAELEADAIVIETNQGGDMAKAVIENELERRRREGIPVSVAVRGVHASTGKRARAEPIAQLYEQHRIDHVPASVEPLTDLEDQLCTWDPAETPKSPDRLDAMVWALTDLMLGEPGILGLYREMMKPKETAA